MNNLIKRMIAVFVILFSFLVSCKTGDPCAVQNQKLGEDWLIQSSEKVNVSDSVISDINFKPKGWYKATVPGSVLGSLVADSVFTDVFYDRNLAKIPDSLFKVPWWYRTSFTISEGGDEQVYRLRFDGISYRADIWLNGHKIAASDTLAGSFKQFEINVSPYIKDGENVLALKITRSGKGDLGIGFVDWNPEPADHNMGIWRDVHLLVSGNVSINHPFVQTKVDTATLDHAWLTVSTNLKNHADKTIQGVLKGSIGKNISFSKKVTIQPHESQQIVFNPSDYEQLSMNHPKLWWVYTLGKPNLYDLHLSFESDNQVSDSQDVRFGIRQISDYLDAEGNCGFRLNGKKVLIKGGGWTDPMLLDATPEYERAGIDYAVQMNLNMIRMEGFWGNNQHLYEMCDEKGILIMVGFSCQWEWENYMGTPEDKYSAIDTKEQNDIAAESWRDQIIWLRNHPSIFLWLYGSDKWPRPSLEKRYLASLKEFDTTRPAISSAADVESEITGPSGVKMNGPYDYVPPSYWYLDSTHGGAFGFNTETSPGPEIPVLESLKKMIPKDSLWPINDAWMYHAARGEFHNLTNYNRAMDKRLGEPTDLKDYLKKAQFLNYEGMRAMFEAFEANRFKATGIIQWMYNASWPKLWWQLYDYYLMPTGAFYGARIANEPLHISYNYGQQAIDVMNNTAESAQDLSAEVKVLDFDMKELLSKKIDISNLSERSTQSILQLPHDLSLSKTWFLDLRLFDKQRHLKSTNFYALSTQKDELDEAKTNWYVTPQLQYADLSLLQQLPEVDLDIEKDVEKRKDSTFVHVHLKNPDSSLAFMVHLDLKKGNTEHSVVPVFWDANYITLLPDEERTVSVFCHTKDLEDSDPVVVMDGWNIK